MDPNTVQPAQDATQQAGSQVPQQPVRQPVQPVPQPAAPVGGKKEALAEIVPPTEWVSTATPEIVLPQEVKDAGVEAHPVVPQVSPSAQQSGVRMAHEAMTITPVATETINIQTSQSMLHQLKAVHKSWKDAMSWLVRLIIKEQDKKEKGAAL